MHPPHTTCTQPPAEASGAALASEVNGRSSRGHASAPSPEPFGDPVPPELESLAWSAPRAFDVEPKRVRLIRHSVRNTVFEITGPGPAVQGAPRQRRARFALRIGHTDRTLARVRSEVAWLWHLRRSVGFDVPEPLADESGTGVVAARPWAGTAGGGGGGRRGSVVCVLFHWMPGREPARLTPPRMRELGRMLAQLHEQGRAFQPSVDFDRPSLVPAGRPSGRRLPLCGDPQRVPGLSATQKRLFRDAVTRLRDELAPLWDEPGAVGLQHGDPGYTNLRVQSGRLGLMDFDGCCWAPFLLDLSLALYHEENRSDYPRARDALLEGYASVAALEDLHVSGLAAMSLCHELRHLWRCGQDAAAHASVRRWLPHVVDRAVVRARMYLDGPDAAMSIFRRVPGLVRPLAEDAAAGLELGDALRWHMVRRTAEACAASGHRRVALYGAGRHTAPILHEPWASLGVRVVAVLDDAPRAEEMDGVPVCRPDELERPIDAVVASAEAYEGAILERARAWFEPMGVPVLGIYAS